jgi:hypothetical protein
MPSAFLRRFAVTSLGLSLAVLASHAMRAQQAGPASQPIGPTGTIAGRVVNAATGGPAVGLDVVFQNDVGRKVATATADASGRYTSPPLPVGDYTSGIDIALQPGGTIAGRVTDKATGAPIPGVTITAGRGTGTTNANGDYSIRGLPTDSFTVLTRAPAVSGYIDQLYDGITCLWGRCDARLGKSVSVAAPESTARIDFRLWRGAQIAGRVTNAATGAPVAGVDLTFHPVAHGELSTASTDAQDGYVSSGLPPGPYSVYTGGYSRGSDGGMLNQIYPGKPVERDRVDLRSGTPVTAVEGSTIGGIDFALATGGTISGWGFDEGVTDVRIGGRLAPSVECGWSRLRVVIPPGTPGPADIVVTTPEGSVVLWKGYTYVAGQAVAPPRR